FRQSFFRIRLDRAHLNEQLALHLVGEQAGGTAIHLIEGGSIGQDGDDRFRLFGKLLWTCCRGGTEFCKRLRLLGRAVPHGKPMPNLDEPLRNGSSHLTNAGDAKLHSKSLLCEEKRRR